MSDEATVEVVVPGYFETMGIELIRGRVIDASDRADAPVVAVVDERFARGYFGEENPIGQAVEGWGFGSIEIIGVVNDVAHYGVLREGRQTLYVPHAQRSNSNMQVVVRATSDALALVPAVNARVAALDPSVPVTAATTMEERIADTLSGPRTAALLGSIMAVLGALLSVVGVHALVAWTVTRRTREIGVRLALGAEAGPLRTALLARTLRPALVGVCLGLAAALFILRAMGAWVHGVSTLDPASYALAGVALMCVIGVAAWLPALRVTRVDPVGALRAE